MVCHQTKLSEQQTNHNPVDEKQVPVPHFGVVLEMQDWIQLRDKLLVNNTKFLIDLYIRFKGLAGEQAILFFYDSSGNALEFKAFKNIELELFKKS